VALKILLADDSMTAQNMGKKILVDAGYEVVAVSNGAAAIKKVAAERPDLAILDVYMPGYTGLEVCERVKASAETSKIPVLLTVGKMEPFNPEDVNRVKADGVMIKPFEASDLIAAVQSIAQRLLAPAPTPKVLDATLKLKGYEDTLRIPPPRAAEPPRPPFGDTTVRIPAPSGDHDQTLRLTPEQVRAFQDASYKDWISTTTEPSPNDTQRLAAPEMPVGAPEPEPEPAMPVIPAAAAQEPAIPAMQFEASSTSRETPVFSAMAASGVVSEHDIFTESSSPAAPMEPAQDAPPAPIFYTPVVSAEEEEEPRFAIAPPPLVTEEETVQVAPPPVMEEAPAPAVQPMPVEPVAPPLEPVVTEAPIVSEEPVVHEAIIPEPIVVPEPIVSREPIIAPEPMIAPEPVMLEPVMAAAPPVVEAPVWETSAPKTPGPVFAPQAAEFEPTVAPPVEMAVPQAKDFEATSAAQEQGSVIAQDPGLITSSDDMSEFVTKFGVENAEPVHVGMASDLTEEQLAAITTPMTEPPAEVAESPAAAEPTLAPSPMQEVGTIAAQAIEAPEPVVAYVPGYTDTQTFPAVRDEEPEPPAPVVAAEPVAEAAPAPEPEPVVASASVTAPEPEPVVVHEAAPALASVPSPIIHAVEAAIAAAAGTAATAGIAHVLHTEAPHVEEPMAHAAAAPAEVQELLPPLEEPAPPGPAESSVMAAPAPAIAEPEPLSEPMGDAALAEELAAALAKKEAEEHAKRAAEDEMMESTAAAASEPSHSLHGINDSKLAEAVARAFENLKPQLITEIIKELMR